jgi:hypothetical protein
MFPDDIADVQSSPFADRVFRRVIHPNDVAIRIGLRT